MADASQESIRRLIENSEKGLAQIEVSLPQILKTRHAVEGAIKTQGGSNVVLDLMLVILDTLLAENEVIYDLSASLNALLRANDDYAKRYYMQSLNLCFWESCQLFVGEGGDGDGLLTRLEQFTKQLNQAGCQFIARHIIDDIQEFRKDYCDKDLRNITRHYDDPIKMYEKQKGLKDIDFFARGVSQLMAIRMEVTVLSSYLSNLLSLGIDESRTVASGLKCKFDLKGLMNDAIFKAFKERNLKDVVQRTMDKGQPTLNDCYGQYQKCLAAEQFLKERDCQIPEEFKKMELLLRLRMEALFLRYDVACSIWGYLNAASDKERSQNLRLLHITKQAALTHIYGYTEKVREKSLWAAIKRTVESRCEMPNMNSIERSLKDLTRNLNEDKDGSQIFAHYRFKQDFYIPARLEAFEKMEHHKELIEAMKLLNICSDIEVYTTRSLYCIGEEQKQERKKRLVEWNDRIEGLVSDTGDNERVKEALKPLRDLVEMVYGDAKLR